MKNYAEILFVNEVRKLQDEDGTGEIYSKVYKGRTNNVLTASDINFISTRESFYIGSVSSTGWPYVQHRGGPEGFLKVIGKDQLGFADYKGNRQFITMGHAAKSNKVALFLMDYEYSTRLKILGHLTMQHVKDADQTLCEKLSTPGQGMVDRIATIKIVALDWNCPKFIPQLIDINKLKEFPTAKLQELKEENEMLKRLLAEMKQNI